MIFKTNSTTKQVNNKNAYIKGNLEESWATEKDFSKIQYDTTYLWLLEYHVFVVNVNMWLHKTHGKVRSVYSNGQMLGLG